MKRLITSVILLVAIICVSTLSLYSLRDQKEAIMTAAAELRSMSGDPDPAVLQEKSQQRFEDWTRLPSF